MTNLLIVRHAQASFGADNYDQLSARGETQAKKLGEWLAYIAWRPDAVLVGGLARHRQTAQLCLEHLDREGEGPPLEAREISGLREYDHVEVMERYQPGLLATLKARFARGDATVSRDFYAALSQAVTRWISGDHADYTDSWIDFKTRVRESLHQLTRDHQQVGNVLLVTSGGPLTAMFQVVTGCNDAAAFAIGHGLINCGITRLVSQSGGWRLSSFNTAPHLELTRDKSLITYI